MISQKYKKMFGKINKNAVLIYTAALIFMIITVALKKNYHVDELLSFVLSNNANGGFSVEYGRAYGDVEELYTEQLGAQSGGLFDYATVFKNQADDVHPPLYYALLHTICSLTPDSVSKWQPAVVNIIFALLTLWVVRKILMLFAGEKIKDKKYEALINTASLIYAVLPGTLSDVSFFRMYVMATFMVTWASYVILRMIVKLFQDERIDRGLWAELFLSAVCCAQTHYYCIMFLVLINAVLFAYLIMKRKSKEIVCQFVTAGGQQEQLY